VRTPAEVEAGTIPGSVNIPVDELRERLGELPPDKEILVFCQVGLRGYLACRILSQHGLDCRNLTGGYKTYRAAVGMLPKEEEPAREMIDDTGERPPSSDPTTSRPAQVVKEIDARSLQCPGPILKLRTELDQVAHGQAVTILASDPGFPSDVAAWCQSTGHRLLEMAPKNGACRATIARQHRAAAASTGTPKQQAKATTMVLFSGDLDKALAGFIIANGAAAMGSQVTMFFTFWGLNALRKPEKVTVAKNLVERMFGWMMPRGAERLKLSKMNMGGLGAAMIKGIMRKKNVATLSELIRSAKEAGVRLVACSMSMNLMGIRREELIDGVEEGGVAMYLNKAERGNVNLFI
jgi:peroxiredoxin family protein/rhodanese-related sulfurtransferase/TusA-related sulfurtransferase